MRLPERPEPGLVLCYSYLWNDQRERGRVEGSKDRPAVIVLARKSIGTTELVYVAPITHSPPTRPGEKVTMPPSARKRLGLDDEDAWISAMELNVFVWPGPDLRPIRRSSGTADEELCTFGFLPRAVFRALQGAIHRNWVSGRMRAVKR